MCKPVHRRGPSGVVGRHNIRLEALPRALVVNQARHAATLADADDVEQVGSVCAVDVTWVMAVQRADVT